MRALHWHPNADEWQYFLEGTSEMTVFLAQGNSVTEQFNAGDVGYVPKGAGHYIKNTGTDLCRILIGFNNGHYQAIDVSEWLAGTPDDVLEATFGLSADIVRKLPKSANFIVPPKQ